MARTTSSRNATRDAPRAPGTTHGMRSLVLQPGADRATLARLPAPRPSQGEALVRTLLTGIDGTDEEVVERGHGETRAGDRPFVLGHECLGEVVEAPLDSGLRPGDRVVPLVRHGCGRCEPCARGESDLCATGDYTEHGIVGLDGFMREMWADDPATLVKVPPEVGDDAVLAEPLSIVVKAFEVMRTVQQARLPGFDGFRGQRALLAGTGSLGSLAAFLLEEKGIETWALDRSPDDAVGASLLRELGARHVNSEETRIADVAREVGGFDLVIEATGSPKVTFDAVLTLAPNGVMCMLGVPGDKDAIPVEADNVMRQMVLRNQVLVGSVNSNRRHFEEAFAALARFRSRRGAQLDRVLTHRYSPEEVEEAFRASGDQLVKKAIDWRG